MRAVRLAKVAARAETLRLRQLASRTVVRAVLGVIAVVFLIGALIGVHVGIALTLLRHFGPVGAALIVAGGDLVIAVVFGLVAGLKGPGKVEREALEVRRMAQSQMMESLTISAVVLPLARRAIGRRLVDMAFGTFRAMGKRR